MNAVPSARAAHSASEMCDTIGVRRDVVRRRAGGRSARRSSTSTAATRGVGSSWAGGGRRDPAHRARRAAALGVVAAGDAPPLVGLGIRPARCWDLGAVHRMLVGGWRTLAERDLGDVPRPRSGDRSRSSPALPICSPTTNTKSTPTIRSIEGPPERRVVGRFVDGDSRRAIRWAQLAAECFAAQRALIGQLPDPPTAISTVHSESAAELLCAELEHDGLPIDVAVAESLIADFIGPRPADAVEAATLAARARRAGAPPHPGRAAARSAQSGQRQGAAAARRDRGVRHAGRGASRSCATSTRSSTTCSCGARPSGSRRRSATHGSTRTSGPTAGCAANGRRPTARPAG